MNDPSVYAARDTEVARVLEEYLALLEAGRAPDRAAFLAAHSDLAGALDAALKSLEFVHHAGGALAGGTAGPADGPGSVAPERTLGDFRLVREVGRGGMAVVYEAEQISLRRRVALKVLPFAAVLDPQQARRFQNEAQAAALLHHPHIAPVHAVGCERGVHYYAMQFVEGASLARAIEDVRLAAGLDGPAQPGRPRPPSTPTPLSTLTTSRDRRFLEIGARLGVQAARALDHAHRMGVVHRDVKPANLLVDVRGDLWVVDFGLARSAFDGGLTRTGEMVGTLRYMSPEQAMARGLPVDHRTDVYSLGATLYEFFTLEPAFPGEEPGEVLRAVTQREPRAPRRVNPAIPLDLETILLKAMDKDAGRRYGTAEEMARDLERFLADEAVVARRPSLAMRAARWTRRHRGLVAAALLVLFVGVAALAVGAWREERHTRAALEKSEANLGLARRAVDTFLYETGITEPDSSPFSWRAHDALLESALRFYEAHGDDLAALRKRGAILRALRRYPETEALAGKFLELVPGDVTALVLLGTCQLEQDRPEEALVSVEAALKRDAKSALAHSIHGLVLRELGRVKEALVAFDEAIRLQPDHVQHWNNRAVTHRVAGDLDRALADCNAAIAMDPRSAVAHFNLGAIQTDRGRLGDALAACRQALVLRPGWSMAHDGVGCVLYAQEKLGEAKEAFREAIKSEPGYPDAHLHLGHVFWREHDLDQATVEYALAVKYRPRFFDARLHLGTTLAQRGDRAGGIRELRALVAIAPNFARAHYSLGVMLGSANDLDGAIKAYERTLELQEDYAEAHCNLGHCWRRKAEFQKALTHLRRGHELGSARPDWPFPSKEWVEATERQARMESEIDGRLAGTIPFAAASERIDLALLLYAKARYADSARMYASAFEGEAALAEDLEKAHRYNAACSAALAGAGTDEVSRRWRAQALRWLRADLDARVRSPKGLSAVLEHWQVDADLAAVRDGSRVLAETERAEWTPFWADVQTRLAGARTAK